MECLIARDPFTNLKMCLGRSVEEMKYVFQQRNDHSVEMEMNRQEGTTIKHLKLYGNRMDFIGESWEDRLWN
jgi:hypothetical protein